MVSPAAVLLSAGGLRVEGLCSGTLSLFAVPCDLGGPGREAGREALETEAGCRLDVVLQGAGACPVDSGAHWAFRSKSWTDESAIPFCDSIQHV